MGKQRRGASWSPGKGENYYARKRANSDPDSGSKQSSRPTDARAGVELETFEEVEPIVGYRQWGLANFYPEGHMLISGPNADSLWVPFTRMEAKCWPASQYMSTGTMTLTSTTTLEYPQPSRHDSPDKTAQCMCGINAYKNRIAISPQATNPYIVGEVNLWGRVIEYEDGFRAQFAYPKKLAVIAGGDTAQRIANNLELAYGVPCDVWD